VKMGAGAVLTHQPPDEKLHESTVSLVSDSVRMNKLFYEIAAKMKGGGRINCKTKISITNLLEYFKDSPDPTLKAITKNQQILLEAHKYTATHQKKKR
jgi:hypothetical protein